MVRKNVIEKIECLECGGYFIRLGGGHLEKIHNLTLKEYLMKHPEAKTSSSNFSKRLKEIKKEHYANNATEFRKKAGSRTFDFIKNKKLKTILQRDYGVAKKCLNNKLWKPSIILYASILEAIILEYAPLKKSYYTALLWAQKQKIVSLAEYHKMHIIKDLRNFVHLHKELKEDFEINEHWARTFSDICESIIKRLKSN